MSDTLRTTTSLPLAEATILLRPFDFETLATFVYAQTSRAAFEDGALAALMIVMVGIVPVVLLTRSILKETERA